MVQLTLFLMCFDFGGGVRKPVPFAPHVWKSVMDMRLLGVPYKEEYVTSGQLEEEIPARFGLQKATLPILLVETDDGKKAIVDSYDIACYLEGAFASTTKSLFSPDGNKTPSSVEMGKSYARFIEKYVHIDLQPILEPALLAKSFARFPKEDTLSCARFQGKVGAKVMSELSALVNDPIWCEDVYAKARKELTIIDGMLEDRTRLGGKGSLLTGANPTHADFALFALYTYSLTNTELVKNVWRHPTLPNIVKWLDALFATGLIAEDELLPYV